VKPELINDFLLRREFFNRSSLVLSLINKNGPQYNAAILRNHSVTRNLDHGLDEQEVSESVSSGKKRLIWNEHLLGKSRCQEFQQNPTSCSRSTACAQFV
jgi:hypothetical protein